MPNWYNRLREQSQNKHRWLFQLKAGVWIPAMKSDEEESEIAYKVLSKRLEKITGDASIDTLVDADISFFPMGSGVRG